MWLVVVVVIVLLIVVVAAFSTEGKALRQANPQGFGYIVLVISLLIGALGAYVFYEANAAVQLEEKGTYKPVEPLMRILYKPPPTREPLEMYLLMQRVGRDSKYFEELVEAPERVLRSIRSQALFAILAGVAGSIVGVVIVATGKRPPRYLDGAE